MHAAACHQLEPRASLQRTHRRAGPNSVCAALQAAHSLTFPHTDRLDLDGQQVSSERLIEMLEPYVSPKRIAKIDQVVMRRTYGVTPVLEHTYDMGNLAAVCRTADAFGFGSMQYIRRPDDKYKVSTRSSAGADKWLDVRVWESTTEAVAALKAAGMQLVVTHLSRSSVTMQEVDFTRPTAIVLGNERAGVSQEMELAADYCCVIPMAGFVESFNISVAAALVMYEAARQRTRALGPQTGDLSAAQQQALKAAMMLRSVREPELLIRELLRRPDPRHHQRGRTTVV